MVDGDVEKKLWSAADQLWANTGLKPSQFSTPVLGLIFLRYAEKRFAAAESQIGPVGSGMVARNPTRADFLDRFQKLIDSYNSGSQNIEVFFRALLKLAEDLSEEEQQTIREGLTEEEKAVFDILTKPEPELSEKEKAQVKAVARSLLERLKKDKLVLDWRNKPQTKGAVRQSIEIVLDGGLPDVYDEDIFNTKCDALYRHVFEAYHGGGQSIYGAA